MSEVTKDLVKDLDQWMGQNVDQLPFKDLFSNDKETRVVIPFSVDPTADSVLKKLKQMGDIDFKAGTVKVGNRSIRLGKLVLNNRSSFTDSEKQWWNHSGNPIDELKEAERTSDYAIIVSRNPIDIVRMSDHDGWSSCHSPSGSYFSCAIADAKGAGAVAYVIKKSDLQNIKDLQAPEIFADPSRRVPGVTPISRIRLRKFVNKDNGDFDLAVPEDRVYGKQMPGFEESIRQWVLNKQQAKMKKYGGERPRLKDFQLMGGSYQDSLGSDLFNNLFGDDLDHGEAEYGGEDEGQSMADQMEEEIGMIEDRYRNAFEICSFYASVEDAGDHPYVSYGGYVHLSVPKELMLPQSEEKESDTVPWNKRRNYVISRAVREWARENDIYAEEAEVDGNNVTLMIHDEGGNADPDSFDDFLRYTLKEIDKKKVELRASLYRLFIELGLAKPNKAVSTSSSNKFTHFEWDDDSDGITIELKEPILLDGWATGTIPEMFKGDLMKALTTWADRILDWEKRQGQLFSYEVKKPFSGEFKISPNIRISPVNAWSKPANGLNLKMQMTLNFEPLTQDDHVEDAIGLVTFLDRNYDKFVKLVYDTWHKLLYRLQT